ncbi:hypothetical protein CHS0354_020910 [Potamilus streckersoni]|uniref:SHSP domain-containing protein n=1 Tax=Potamilus streckersoni TaxID=2493646 RepID=A0AAE0W2L9_9BIVA|nr:hypothetical protein CHS0354_020910 [Potamilus streckersoni]
MTQRLPIFKDDLTFEERQSKVWSDMERDMERRRKEWEDEIERMRKDFFTLRPDNDGGKLDSLSDRFSMAPNFPDEGRCVVEKDQAGQPVFRVRFNVQDYKPEEVSVKMDTDKIIVHAKHEEKGGNKTVSREYSREVDIPRDVDPMSLQCTISADGVLSVEAPLPTPGYPTIKNGSRPPLQQERVVQSSASSVSSSARNTPPPLTQTQQTSQPLHSSTFTTFLSGAQGTKQVPSQSLPQSVPTGTATYATTTTEVHGGADGSSAVLDKDRKFKVEVDIEDFKPEELQVKTVDRKLVISAKREEQIGNRTSTKEFNREFLLPDAVDPYSVKAFFSDTGKLLLEAPYVRSVPISHYSESGSGSPHYFSGSPLTGR